MSAIYDRVQRRMARVEKAVGSKRADGTVEFEIWLQDATQPIASQIPVQASPSTNPDKCPKDSSRKQLTITAIPSGYFVDAEQPKTRFYKTPPAAFTPDGTPIWSPKAGYLVLSRLTALGARTAGAEIDLEPNDALDAAPVALAVVANTLAEPETDELARHSADTPNPAVAEVVVRDREAEVADFAKVLAAHRAKQNNRPDSLSPSP